MFIDKYIVYKFCTQTVMTLDWNSLNLSLSFMDGHKLAKAFDYQCFQISFDDYFSDNIIYYVRVNQSFGSTLKAP